MNNENIIQGLISLEVRLDHVYIHLIESAPFNKGKSKMYAGVPGNLIAFACKLSFQRGHDGNVAFISKSQLINHYIESLEAIHVGGQEILTQEEKKLLHDFFSAQKMKVIKQGGIFI